MSNESYNFTGKRALVTGAGRGIGRALVKALSESGAETFALSKTSEHLESLTKENPLISPICVDLTDWEATRKAIEEVGRIDLLVNNAGVTIARSFLETSESDIDSVMGVNFKAAANVSQVVAKGLIAESRPGSIVNISSVLTKTSYDGCGVYCYSKGALDQMTRVMALELGPHNIRVNSVHPTLVTTTDMGKWAESTFAKAYDGRTPLGRFAGQMSEVVDPILFLLSDQASMVHGAFLPIDGGLWTA